MLRRNSWFNLIHLSFVPFLVGYILCCFAIIAISPSYDLLYSAFLMPYISPLAGTLFTLWIRCRLGCVTPDLLTLRHLEVASAGAIVGALATIVAFPFDLLKNTMEIPWIPIFLISSMAILIGEVFSQTFKKLGLSRWHPSADSAE